MTNEIHNLFMITDINKNVKIYTEILRKEKKIFWLLQMCSICVRN